MSAPVYKINPNNGTEGSYGKHDISPHWVLCFWSFNEPRTGISFDPNEANEDAKLKIKSRIIVINDCISVNISRPKSDHIKSAAMSLRLTDTQYDKILNPNDHVAIWMVNHEEDADAIVSRLKKGVGPALNSFMSGFKFLGKIRNVSKSVIVDKQGKPDELINIQAAMFTELNMTMHLQRLFEAEIGTFQSDDAGPSQPLLRFFMQGFNPKIFDDYIRGGGAALKSPNEIIKFFSSIFLGEGAGQSDPTAAKGLIPSNIGNRIKLPKEVFQAVLGQSATDKYIDNIYFFTGLEKYNSGNANRDYSLLTPVDTVPRGAFIESENLKGGSIVSSVDFSDKTIYSVFNMYLNDVCNEMYTTMRYTVNGGIRPTIVARQIPFTTPQLDVILDELKKRTTSTGLPPESKMTTTKFNNLPRWKVDTALINSINIGYGSLSPINFVFISNAATWSSLVTASGDEAKRAQSIFYKSQFEGSTIFDRQDIVKNGLRAYIKETNFLSTTTTDYSEKTKELQQSSVTNGGQEIVFWNALQADFLLNMHLKLSGRVSVSGIQEPICEGDNIEIDGILYHIEQIDYMGRVTPNGTKQFATILTLSNGVYTDSLESVTSLIKYYPKINIAHTYEDRFGLTEDQEGPSDLIDRLFGRGGKK